MRLPTLRKALCCVATSAALVLAALAATSGPAGAAPVASTAAAASALRPCNIYASGGTPASPRTARPDALRHLPRPALPGTARVGRHGRQHRRARAGGYANAAAQDSFCAGTYCTITQALRSDRTAQRPRRSRPVGGEPAADRARRGGAAGDGRRPQGLRRLHLGRQRLPQQRDQRCRDRQPAEGMYMVTEGTHVNNRCCFDYGNAETNSPTPATATWTRSTSVPSAGSRRARRPGPGCGRPGERAVRRRQRLRTRPTPATQPRS